MVPSSLILIIPIDSSMSVLQKKVIHRSHALEDEKKTYQTHKFHRLPKICHSGVSWVEPRATLSHIKKMQRKASGAKAAYVRFTSVAVRHSCGGGCCGLVPKQDSKKLAHIRMLMVSIFSKRSKLENLYLQIWAYLRRRRWRGMCGRDCGGIGGGDGSGVLRSRLNW